MSEDTEEELENYEQLAEIISHEDVREYSSLMLAFIKRTADPNGMLPMPTNGTELRKAFSDIAYRMYADKFGAKRADRWLEWYKSNEDMYRRNRAKDQQKPSL